MQRLVVAAVAAVLGLAALLDLVAADGTGFEPVGVVPFLVAAVGVALLVRRDRLSPGQLMTVSAVLAGVSVLLTAVGHLAAGPALHAPWTLVETATLTLLLATLARRRDRRRDQATLLLLAVALVTGPWRLPDADAALFGLLVAVVTVIALAVGLLRRADDVRAAAALDRVRVDERRRMARDLHDDIAHHVTGIIVTAQATLFVAGPDQTASRSALVTIERSALEALDSMRALVSVLRDPDDKDSRRDAARWPTNLQEMVHRFGEVTGLVVTLDVASGAADPAHVPAAVRQAAQRVTQEALTNVRRHARGATRADVTVEIAGSGLRVMISDDGRTGPVAGDALGESGGGFGLVGLTERAAALGGSLSAGPLNPHGWRVEVGIPLAGPSPGGATR